MAVTRPIPGSASTGRSASAFRSRLSGAAVCLLLILALSLRNGASSTDLLQADPLPVRPVSSAGVGEAPDATARTLMMTTTTAPSDGAHNSDGTADGSATIAASGVVDEAGGAANGHQTTSTPDPDVMVVPGAGEVRRRPHRHKGDPVEEQAGLVAEDPQDRKRRGGGMGIASVSLRGRGQQPIAVSSEDRRDEIARRRADIVAEIKRRVARDVEQRMSSADGGASSSVQTDTSATTTRSDSTSGLVVPKKAYQARIIRAPAYTGGAATYDQPGQKSSLSSSERRSGAAPPGFESNFKHLRLADINGPAAAAEGVALCELAVMASGNCRIEHGGRETWRQCVKRIGVHDIAKVLPSSCTKSNVFTAIISEIGQTGEGDGDGGSERQQQPPSWQVLARNPLYYAQTFSSQGKVPEQVPPHKRSVAEFPVGPRTCASGCKHYPISFGVPERNVIAAVPRAKWWEFLPYTPGPFPFAGAPKYPFQPDDEWLARELHKRSFFAFTHKRGGWDCMRHLEILSSGAIPYFADLELCPSRTLANYPKELIKQAMALRGLDGIGEVRERADTVDTPYMARRPNGHVYFKQPGAFLPEGNSGFDPAAYHGLASQILNHTRHHLTTAAVLSYVLHTIGHEEPRHVLVIGRGAYDYLHQTIESGLSDLRIQATVLRHPKSFVQSIRVPDGEPMTEAELEAARHEELRRTGEKVVAGHGWVYGFRTRGDFVKHRSLRALRSEDEEGVKVGILDGTYDLIIYTYTENEPVTRRPYWTEVSRAIPIERRVFLHHNDDVQDPDMGSRESCKHGWLFKREMRDVQC